MRLLGIFCLKKKMTLWNENEITLELKPWDTRKAGLWGKFKALNALISRGKKE